MREGSSHHTHCKRKPDLFHDIGSSLSNSAVTCCVPPAVVHAKFNSN
jgi:hypothetical protein